jgi:hypothetical protein
VALKIVEDFQPRGVENPRIVDLIAPDRGTGQVVLRMLEPRPWGSDPQQLHQLEDKLNSYFSYVLDGFLARDYPQYEGRPVRIELACRAAAVPGSEEEAFLRAVERFCARNGLTFAVAVSDDPLGGAAPWEAAP